MLKSENCGLLDEKRVLICYYEDMNLDLGNEIDRIASFLEIKDFTNEKKKAIMAATSLEGMQGHITVRKGIIGDWKNYLDEETWKAVDEAYEEFCGDSCEFLYGPLMKYHEF